MNTDFVEREGLHIQEITTGDNKTLYLNAVLDGKLEKHIPIGTWHTKHPDEFGWYRQCKVMFELLAVLADTGLEEADMYDMLHKFAVAHSSAGYAAFQPEEPWYLWSITNSGGAFQTVYRNDTTNEVTVVTKNQWSERMPLSEFYELMEATGSDGETLHPGPSVSFTA